MIDKKKLNSKINFQICTTNRGGLHRRPNHNMVAKRYMPLPSIQESVPRRKDSGSTLRDKSIRSPQIEECIRKVHGPPDVADSFAECPHEVLHGYRNYWTEHGVLRQVHNPIPHQYYTEGHVGKTHT